MRLLWKPFVLFASFVVAEGLMVLAAPEPVAQPTQMRAPDWTRTFGRALQSVAVDGTGRAYVTGYAGEFARHHMVLRKYAPDGREIWTRTWKPAKASASGVDVAVGRNGNVYLAVSAKWEHFEGGTWFLRKYSPGGSLIWHIAAPDRPQGGAEALSSVAVSAGMVVVTGYDFGCCGMSFVHDGWVRAFDPEGHRLWTTPFHAPHIRRTDNAPMAVSMGDLGGAYVTGWIAMGPEAETRLADHEVIVQELSPSGREVWTRILRDRHARDMDMGTGVAAFGDRLFVTARLGMAYMDCESCLARAWLARLTLDGRTVWTRSWGLHRHTRAAPAGVDIASSGDPWVVGSQRGPAETGVNGFLRTYSPKGHLLRDVSIEQALEGTFGTSVAAADGSVCAAGYTGARTRANGGWLWKFAG